MKAEGQKARVKLGGPLLTVAVALIALNLRPAITSVGPLLDQVRESLGASPTWAGLLTTVPVLCFAFVGLAAPVLALRAGLSAGVSLALAFLGCGLMLRVLDGEPFMLSGTLLAAAGIAVAGVLLPVVIKRSFPAKIGLMTGVYTAALQTGSMLGFALTVPLGTAFGGWRPALASWATLTVLALAAWLGATGRTKDGLSLAVDDGRTKRSLLGSPLAWIITIFFGLQALVAFVAMGWLPQVLMGAGVDREDAGLMTGLLALLALPTSLLVAPMAAKRGSQSAWNIALSLSSSAGILGLILAPSAAPLLWTVLLGIGLGVFSLALATIQLRARTSHDTVMLSAMAQGFGYLLAAAGPFLFGLLHDVTGGWREALTMIFIVLIVQTGFAALAGRPRYV